MDDPYAIDGTKIQYHIPRVAKWLGGEKVSIFPIYVEISPVGHCNHRCTFCAVDYIGYKIRRLDTSRLKDILLDIAIHDVKSVMFAGEGEPLLHPELPEIINYARRQGLSISITTNAVPLSAKFVDECLPSVEWIKASINGGPKSYAKVHQAREGDWDKVWKNLSYAVKKAGEVDGGARKTVIGCQTVLLPEVQEDLQALIQQAKSVGLDYIVIKPYSQHKKSITREYEGISYASQKEELEWLARTYSTAEFKVIPRLHSMDSWDSKERGYDKCYSTPYFWAYIMATGDVYGCSAYLLDERFCYGNINTEWFHEIWRGAKRRASIDYVENKLDITECRKNCRMHKVNTFLWDIKHPGEHANFI